MEAAAATTKPPEAPGGHSGSPRPHVRRTGAGPDRASVTLFSLAAFLAVLALLGWQLRATPARTAPARPVVVLRRIYETKVIETIPGSGSGASVSQSVSSSGSGSAAVAAPTTRSSAAP